MATPFVPVPAHVPADRPLREDGKPRRTQRASSACSESSSGRRRAAAAPCQSPITRARLNATERTAEYSCYPHSDSPLDTAGPDWEERPLTPTVLGYEVMEERAKFTVYKVLVKKSPEESWVVFRRYTDFSRLNEKLKEMFPGFRLSLPPKRWFKDNYDTEFLEDRQLGLQAFLQNLVAHKDIANCWAVREFLCLDDPPGPFDSLEESRAFCETLEECNYRLQKELVEKQREIDCLKKSLEEKDLHIQNLERTISGEVLTPDSLQCVSAPGSDSSVDVESSAVEADQELTDENECVLQSGQSSAVCWCAPSVSSGSPPVIQVTPVEH
ncbi:sorting nexin-16 [Triplophysa dalaica]|uniref:sorting nexin-16 n=1 Tax=Triplophysa dalaica TaxID=1582913 RepID=UPI0024DF41B0|nr:sorting nexin-16 [Triplophysa dalaica]